MSTPTADESAIILTAMALPPAESEKRGVDVGGIR